MSRGCPMFRDDLTAFVDGELGLVAGLRMRWHLHACRDCGAEAERLRAAVLAQGRLLTEPAEVDVERLLGDARAAIVALGRPDVATPRAPARRHLPWNQALVAAVATLVLVAGATLWFATRPAVLIPLGLEEPPALVAKKPDLFREYEIIRELDALEHFDVVNQQRLEKDRPRATRPRET